MRKLYNAPELEIVKFTLKDVIMTSPIEETIGENIGGGEGGGDEPIIDVGL